MCNLFSALATPVKKNNTVHVPFLLTSPGQGEKTTNQQKNPANRKNKKKGENKSSPQDSVTAVQDAHQKTTDVL